MTPIALPNMMEGEYYRECITLTGTRPFKIESSNIIGGEVKIVGDQLCFDIPNPKNQMDLAVVVSSSCSGCDPVTFVASLGLNPAEGCICTPVSIPLQPVPPLVTGKKYFASIRIDGTAPFDIKSCGASAPDCFSIEVNGALVTVKGDYKGIGTVRFAIKNACSCDCINFVIDQISGRLEEPYPSVEYGDGYIFAESDFRDPLATKKITSCDGAKYYIYPSASVEHSIPVTICGDIAGYAKNAQ